MPRRKYHRRQAETLMALARSTKDKEAATEFAAMAAEHMDVADEEQPPDPDAPPQALRDL